MFENKEKPQEDEILLGKARAIGNNKTVQQFLSEEISEEEAAKRIFEAFNRKPDSQN